MSWSPAGPERYRLSASGAPAPAVGESGLQSVAAPSAAGASAAKALSLDNPLLPFAAIAALTFGLIGFSTSGKARIGKAVISGTVGAGSTK